MDEPVFQDEGVDAHRVEPFGDVRPLVAHHQGPEPAAGGDDHGGADGLVLRGRVVDQHGLHDVGHDRHAVRSGDGLLLPVPFLRSRGRPRVERDLGSAGCLGVDRRGPREGDQADRSVHRRLRVRPGRWPGPDRIRAGSRGNGGDGPEWVARPSLPRKPRCTLRSAMPEQLRPTTPKRSSHLDLPSRKRAREAVYGCPFLQPARDATLSTLPCRLRHPARPSHCKHSSRIFFSRRQGLRLSAPPKLALDGDRRRPVVHDT